MKQESCKIYYCYKATNQINGKVYIGFAADPEQRWREHKRDADKGKGYIFSKLSQEQINSILSRPDERAVLLAKEFDVARKTINRYRRKEGYK